MRLSPYEVLRRVGIIADRLAAEETSEGARAGRYLQSVLLPAVNPNFRLVTRHGSNFRTKPAAEADMKAEVRKLRQGGRKVLSATVEHEPGTSKPYRWVAWVVQP